MSSPVFDHRVSLGMPLAASTHQPDTFDWFAMLFMAGVMLGLPLAGYVFMALDIRAYYRSLRQALVTVRGYVSSLPSWAHKDSPPCLQVFGLSLPCTREDVLEAYRERVKTAHPDVGGSREAFAKLQRHFEQALALTAEAEQDR